MRNIGEYEKSLRLHSLSLKTAEAALSKERKTNPGNLSFKSYDSQILLRL